MTPRDYQLRTVEHLLGLPRPFRLALESPTGCVAGGTLVTTNRSGKGVTRPIAKHWECQRHPRRRPHIPTRVRSFLGDRIGLHRARHFVYSGLRHTLRLQLSDGRSLRATPDHEILTENGFVELGSLCGRDRVIIEGKWYHPKKGKAHYRRVQGLAHHIYASRFKTKREGVISSVPLHRLVVESEMNGVSCDEFIDVCRYRPEQANCFKFLDPEVWAVHHRDGDHTNNSLKNLEVLTHAEHHAHHGKNGKMLHLPGFLPASAGVTSVVEHGLEKTFDVICDDPHRNFVANGVVVHNSGKTFIMAMLARYPLRHLILLHRSILLDQTARLLTSMNLRFGYRASGYKEDPEALIQLGMVQTEIRRKKHTKVDLVHIDEIHQQGGPTYRDTFAWYHDNGASLLGYTATPSDLGDMVEDVYRVATVPDLIDQGYLCRPKVFSCGMPEVRLLDKLRRDSKGEYLAGDVAKIIRPEVIFGPVLENYRRLTNGTPFVLFAHSVKASLYWALSLTGAGVPTAHVDGNDVWVDGELHKSNSAKRAEVFARLEAGELKGISNRFVLREGWDCPAVGHAIITCPMGLRRTWVQACGRIMRPHENREFSVVQDHCGSWLNHPALDSGAEWEWGAASGIPEKAYISAMRHDQIAEPIMCPKCGMTRRMGDTCPHCGHRYGKLARYVQEANGALRLVEGKTYEPRRTKYRPGDEAIAERLYWSAVKHPRRTSTGAETWRTAEQCISYFAYQNNWRWLQRDLPCMPLYEGDFFIPWKDIPRERLRPPTKGWTK